MNMLANKMKILAKDAAEIKIKRIYKQQTIQRYYY